MWSWVKFETSDTNSKPTEICPTLIRLSFTRLTVINTLKSHYFSFFGRIFTVIFTVNIVIASFVLDFVEYYDMSIYDNDAFYWIAFVVFHVFPCNVCTSPFYIWSWHWRPRKIYIGDWMHCASLLHELAYFSHHRISRHMSRTLSAGRLKVHLLDPAAELV